MKIQAINYPVYCSANNFVQNNQLKKDVNFVNKADTVSFGRMYTSLITDIAQRDLKNTKQLSSAFAELIEHIRLNSQVKKNESFDLIERLTNNRGLNGLLFELRDPDTKELQVLVGKAHDDFVNLASINGKPIMRIANWGPHGFFDQSTTTNQDVHIIFSSPLENAFREFCLDSKGRLGTSSHSSNMDVHVYYHSSGNKRKEVEQITGGMPDVTYYNEDGSKAFFKNWLFGGTPTVGF